jgi:hypothetical protein
MKKEMPKRISIQLTHTRFDQEKDSLGELLEQVWETLHPPNAVSFCPDDPNWICRWAIRAFCEEIIRTGQMWCPPEVSFTNFWCKRAKGFRFQASRN